MKYSLDTNTCIRAINGRVPQVRAHLLQVPASQIVVCSVVRGELFYGAAKSQTPERTRQKQVLFLEPFVSLPFDDASAAVYGEIRAKLDQAGAPIGPHDLQIAAIALLHNLTLITHNIREFARVPNLQIVDWETG